MKARHDKVEREEQLRVLEVLLLELEAGARHVVLAGRPGDRREAYQRALSSRHLGEITTEIAQAPEFYYAEDYHQQYLAKNPGGYCGLGGTGVSCPVGLGVETPSAS